ncbi:hypothetical protein FVE85_7453 [Porphyridium purpureum]|uniref:Uncharacterized protein n=1 Tax=Porphyridium purpureum TaxID=35688 RepID=A0A5J4Z9Q2_PORPP|nr:hypothetical protein FVE85_7453 [Porphyridium purpureum]|eukprot:POR9793..scf295_1
MPFFPAESCTTCFVTGGLRPVRRRLSQVRPTVLRCCSPRISSYPSSARWLRVSALNVLSGAALGPCLDNYHSAFGLLRYVTPLHVGTSAGAITTTWWTPLLFGFAGLTIGGGTLVLDILLTRVGDHDKGKVNMPKRASVPNVLLTISAFSGIYYMSGYLYACGMDKTDISVVLWLLTFLEFGSLVRALDVSLMAMSLLTMIAGPAAEAALIHYGHLYTYAVTDANGVIPWLILPRDRTSGCAASVAKAKSEVPPPINLRFVRVSSCIKSFAHSVASSRNCRALCPSRRDLSFATFDVITLAAIIRARKSTGVTTTMVHAAGVTEGCSLVILVVFARGCLHSLQNADDRHAVDRRAARVCQNNIEIATNNEITTKLMWILLMCTIAVLAGKDLFRIPQQRSW